ncbi:MAG: autotransporter outer membrane beta-barrel domain-containing protein, partial [Pseudomonadota bacterium]|nr:autotransporter outer membrane beta-barrel domain-containing protein [Pseudomonadota bacterium]
VGGDGGDGGDVVVNNTGQIVTRGDNAHGIVAQSIGGGGGNASMGFALTGEPTTFVTSNTLSALIGATGGGVGGTGGSVTVNHSGDITVLGEGSQAIKAESINGGGGTLQVNFESITDLSGDPSLPIYGSLSPDPDDSPADPLVAARAGAQDTSDMNSERVTVNSTGTFQAGGNNSTASLVQSIGGGGGQASIIASIGVTPTSPNTPLTLAADGGVLPRATPPAPVDVRLDLGGVNGVNNNGGDVDSVHSGDLLTTGINSPGLILQSLGGGGGLGLVSLTAPSGALLGPVDLYLGSTNGSTEQGGAVARSQSGSVMTTGAFSPAAVLQSIGGGGGFASANIDAVDQSLHATRFSLGANGGSALDGGSVDGTFTGGVITLGDRSIGIVGQSVGAGGGYGQVTGSNVVGVTLGGQNGASGNGGDVSVTNTGMIGTTGLRSHGVLLQSIGGGGGIVMADASTLDHLLTGEGSGDGGVVSFVQDGSIITEGESTYGLVLQSIGGGGGWIDGVFAGTSGGTGAGGAIDFAVTGDMWSTNTDSTAIFAQSVGADGGGNIIGTVDGFIRGGTGMGRGVIFDGGADNVLTTNGTLSAVSTWAIESTTGNDTVNNTGLVVGNIDLGSGRNAFNNQLDATFIAYSTIDLGGPEPTSPQEPITLVTGDKGLVQVQDTASTPASTGVSAQAQDAAPVSALDGGKPTFQIQDTGLPAQVVSSDIMTDGKGSAPVQDLELPVQAGLSDKGSAPVQDLIPMGASADSFAAPVQRDLTASMPSISGGTFTNAGNFLMGLSATTRPIDLRAGETFYNLDANGDPETNIFFGARVINDVALNGDYVQTADGHLVFDVAYGPYDYDHVTLTGDVTVDGTGDVTFIWLSDNEPIPLFTSTGGTATDNGLDITDTLAVDFSVRAEANRIMLDIDTDFGGVDGLNRNESALGGHMDSNLDIGGAEGTGRLLAWLDNLQDPDLYKYIMTELNPEPHVAVLQGLTNTSLSFSDDLINCGPPSSMRSEEECNWSRMDVGTADRDRSFERFSTQADTFSVRAGFQRPVNDTWNVGAAIGYETINFHDIDGSRAGTNGEGVTVGATANRDFQGGGIFAATLSGGWMKYETIRMINVFEPQIAESEPEAGYLDLRVRSGLMTEFDDGFYLLPRADLSFTNLIHNGFHETGADGIGMRSGGDSDWMIIGSPALEMGWSRDFEDGREFIASATIGGRWHSDDYVGLPMSFVEAPAGVIPAQIETQIDQEMYTFDAGFEFIQGDRMNLSFGYRGEFGETTENHQAGFQLGLRF